ncbi:hypothetical protein [Stutzerimonas kunmingensis]|uniref:hypothetical protein n=1 Tax=Stutzerimonas kunmingensis TaxID=1211807 RepID=UPI0028B028E6|nr:hypothetical protein [Stutzerimonas kunmingensis]
MAKWIGVDLDGTLATYHGGMGKSIGEPIAPMLELVRSLTSAGVEVRIFTARASDPNQHPAINSWLRRHGLGHCAITNVKDFDCHLILDDRAARVEWNRGQQCGGCRAEASRRFEQLGFRPVQRSSFLDVI